jgi:hypothetical protein
MACGTTVGGERAEGTGRLRLGLDESSGTKEKRAQGIGEQGGHKPYADTVMGKEFDART